jgi:hypothetical protein
MEVLEKISVTKTAKMIRKAPQYVRLGLQQGRLPFGSAVQNEKGRWNYHIVPKKLYEYIGENGGAENEN